MPEAIRGTAIYLLPGMSERLEVPVSSITGGGWFSATEIPVGFFSNPNSISDIVRGFVVEDAAVGTIARTDTTEAAVIYTHRKPYKNSIWFFALTGEYGLVNVVAVPIHDHSSIVQGGPAYGTYFDDNEAEEAGG
jgi:hypothetical protein